MKGLLLKDGWLTARYCRSYLLFILVFFIVSRFSGDSSFFSVYPVLLAGLLPMTLQSYDEKDRWDIYSGTLPYTRAQLVSAKYTIGLIAVAAVWLLFAAAEAVKQIRTGNFVLETYAATVAMLLPGLIGPTLVMPFIFRFGVEKGRIAHFICIGVLCAAGTVWLTVTDTVAILPVDRGYMLPLLLLAALVLYALSWRLSVVWYQKREF